MKWVIHYTMFFIVIILLFVFLHMQKHQYQTAKRQKQYIVQIEQYIHNESIHEDNTPFRIFDAQTNPFISAREAGILNENWCKHPIIETHQFMDLYIPIRA